MNLVFNIRAFYLFFIVLMIASMAAIGLGPGFGGGSSAPAPIFEETPPAEETPTGTRLYPEGPLPTIDASKPHEAIIETNKGKIRIDLATDAPETVNSFAFLAGAGFYNDTVFFYVAPGFVAQAGDPTCTVEGANVCTGLGWSGYTLPVEKTKEGHEQWAVVAPATIAGQEVHGSQFRILYAPDRRLDGSETVFGKVVEGQQIMESLPAFKPCSVVESDDCQAEPDMASALVIERVIVQPKS